ncbi:MAG TPA: hypothetical protein VN213_02515, partial [Solirubrobacteraceae bacterium]|nr:hypothetical protein [Solirubrobacteraceae bacterium]
MWPPPDTDDRVCRDFRLANEHRTAPPRLGPTTRSLDKLLHLLTGGQVVTLAGDWTLPLFRRPGFAGVRVRDVAPVTIALAWRAGTCRRPARGFARSPVTCGPARGSGPRRR